MTEAYIGPLDDELQSIVDVVSDYNCSSPQYPIALKIYQPQYLEYLGFPIKEVILESPYPTYKNEPNFKYNPHSPDNRAFFVRLLIDFQKSQQEEEQGICLEYEDLEITKLLRKYGYISYSDNSIMLPDRISEI